MQIIAIMLNLDECIFKLFCKLGKLAKISFVCVSLFAFYKESVCELVNFHVCVYL